jgi:hypothetical protein
LKADNAPQNSVWSRALKTRWNKMRDGVNK